MCDACTRVKRFGLLPEKNALLPDEVREDGYGLLPEENALLSHEVRENGWTVPDARDGRDAQPVLSHEV